MTDIQMPPRANEAELSVIGCILLEPYRLDEICEVVQPGDFANPYLASAFRVALKLAEKHRPIDPVSVAAGMVKAKDADADEASEVLSRACGAIPHAAHARYHATLVKSCAMRNRIIRAAGDLARTAHDPAAEVEEIATAWDQVGRELQERIAGQGSDEAINGTLIDVLSALCEGKNQGLKTHLHDLDNRCHGLQPGNLIIIAARPSMGKTALVVNMMRDMGHNGDGVYMFSIEQTKSEIAERMLSLESGLSTLQLRGHIPSESMRAQLLDAASRLSDLPIWIDDSARSMMHIAARARIQARKKALRCIIVDYLQLVEPEDKRAPREQQVAAISRGLKFLAKDLNLPVVALAQLNRGIENRAVKRPQLSDLRESGAIEQDADMVTFLHREKESEDEDAALIIAKNRNGPLLDVRLQWTGSLMRFQNSARTYETEFAE